VEALAKALGVSTSELVSSSGILPKDNPWRLQIEYSM
jgi:hypothetical protein